MQFYKLQKIYKIFFDYLIFDCLCQFEHLYRSLLNIIIFNINQIVLLFQVTQKHFNSFQIIPKFAQLRNEVS